MHFDTGMRSHGLDSLGHAIHAGFGIRSAPGNVFLHGGGETAKLRLLFDENHIKASGGRFERRAQAGDAAADHQKCPGDLAGDGLERLHLLRPYDPHAQAVLGEHLRIFVVRLVAPGNLLAQIHAIEHHLRIELGIERELSRLDARRAGRDDDGIHRALLEILAD